MQFNTPILFLIFNRPDLTEQSFSVIREVQPKQLFIAADGARLDKEGENDLCQQTRNLVMHNIDWDCEVKTLFRNENLGCKIAVSSAISWFFDHVEEGIILEDDCLPNLSFFNFCSELLSKYRFNETIMHISGNNFQMSSLGNASYYLSKLPHIWGWATWKRAWSKYDVNLTNFNKKRTKNYFNNVQIDLYWKNIFTQVYNNQIDTWDYQWSYTLFSNDGFSIQPQYNLVKNIGFDSRSSRTSSSHSYLANLKTNPILNIIHPNELIYDLHNDINFHFVFDLHEPFFSIRPSFNLLFRAIIRKFIF